ncbi:hypothetical protein [Glycomyces dulcitolivorans]|uniref:hypothetical protein n=1 Tax=Glycomyces dulcitolivorans TaxID=2200759 RepID=UPI001300487F|nr:hypothetical protein [Glycomyces dulcitolivorans]
MTTPKSELPTWAEAQDQAVAHATAAAAEQDPAARQHHTELAQVWAIIALSRANIEQADQLALSLRDLSATINDLPSRIR